MRLNPPLAREIWLAVKFAAVCMIGFVIDAGSFWAWMAGGFSKDISRVVALMIALQATFFLTRWLVFESHEPGSLGRQWWRYMVANGFGAMCNIALFETLSHAGLPLLSGPWVALVTSSSIAFLINYAGTRLFVYGRSRAGAGAGGALSVKP